MIRDIIPVPLRRVRTTRSSTHSYPFQVSLPNPRTLPHKSSIIPRTFNSWSVLPSSRLPESYNLPSFKSYLPPLLAFHFFLIPWMENSIGRHCLSPSQLTKEKKNTNVGRIILLPSVKFTQCQCLPPWSWVLLI